MLPKGSELLEADGVAFFHRGRPLFGRDAFSAVLRSASTESAGHRFTPKGVWRYAQTLPFLSVQRYTPGSDWTASFGIVRAAGALCVLLAAAGGVVLDASCAARPPERINIYNRILICYYS